MLCALMLRNKNMPTDFYSSYSAYKKYETPSLAAKDIARFDEEIWVPGAFSADLKCLEIGSGTGQFLAYLSAKGVGSVKGIDHDPALTAVQPSEVADCFDCMDVWEFCKNSADGSYDRIVLLDVLEHFTPEEAFRLLSELSRLLSVNGKVVIKVPNAASPWGLGYQHGDLTHKTSYTSDSLRQLATACAMRVERLYDQRRGSKRRLITDAIVCRFLSWALLTPPPFWGANLYCIVSSQQD